MIEILDPDQIELETKVTTTSVLRKMPIGKVAVFDAGTGKNFYQLARQIGVKVSVKKTKDGKIAVFRIS